MLLHPVPADTGRSSIPQARSQSLSPWSPSRRAPPGAQGGQLPHGPTPSALSRASVFGPIPQSRRWPGGQEFPFAPRLDDDEPVRFVQVGGHLGHELVRRDPHGGREIEFPTDPFPELPGDDLSRPEQPAAPGDIQEGLVDAHRLHEIGEPGQDSHDEA